MNVGGNPKWICEEQVLHIHQKTIELQGRLSGIRDTGLLESAFARPENNYAYGGQDKFELVAA